MPLNPLCPVCGKPGRRAETIRRPGRQVEQATPEGDPRYVCITVGCAMQDTGQPYSFSPPSPQPRDQRR